jgi:hypothetical protein
MGTWEKVVTEGNQVTKGHVQWYYYFSNLATINTRYAERWNDDFGIANSVNGQITSTNDTSAAHWPIVRASRIMPYDATITRFQVNLEASGSNGDVDIELWKASKLTKGTNYTSSQAITIDHLATLTYDYDANYGSSIMGNSRAWYEDTTSFNDTSVTAGDYLFVCVKRTNGTDGSSYHIHSTVCYDITH